MENNRDDYKGRDRRAHPVRKKIKVATPIIVILTAMFFIVGPGHNATNYIKDSAHTCGGCHAMRHAVASYVGSVHFKNEVTCMDCHYDTIRGKGKKVMIQAKERPDHVRVRANISNEDCAVCHKDQKDSTVHHFGRCLGCHSLVDDPHKITKPARFSFRRN